MMNKAPDISVVIPTRNRGNSVVATLESVFQNTYPSFEVILVDQSTNQDTAHAVEAFESDPRFRYVHSETRGTGVSRNIGLKLAHGEMVAYTDDDCTVPIHWLAGMWKIIKANPRIAMVFCSIEPGPYNHSDGYVPAYVIPRDRVIRSMRGLFWGLGLGAGMAFRRESLTAIGGFDNCLGPGSKFHAGEDHDIAIRLLLRGSWIQDSSTIIVTHHGFRSWREGKTHTQRDWFSGGATYVKPIKCGHWKAGILFVSVPLLRGLLEPFLNVLRGKSHPGFGRIVYFAQGVIQGLKTQIDCRLVLYKPDKTSGQSLLELGNNLSVDMYEGKEEVS